MVSAHLKTNSIITSQNHESNPLLHRFGRFAVMILTSSNHGTFVEQQTWIMNFSFRDLGWETVSWTQRSVWHGKNDRAVAMDVKKGPCTVYSFVYVRRKQKNGEKRMEILVQAGVQKSGLWKHWSWGLWNATNVKRDGSFLEKHSWYCKYK